MIGTTYDQLDIVPSSISFNLFFLSSRIKGVPYEQIRTYSIKSLLHLFIYHNILFYWRDKMASINFKCQWWRTPIHHIKAREAHSLHRALGQRDTAQLAFTRMASDAAIHLNLITINIMDRRWQISIELNDSLSSSSTSLELDRQYDRKWTPNRKHLFAHF